MNSLRHRASVFSVRVCGAAALAVLAVHVRAEVVEIKWSRDGRSEQRLSVAPGGFVELCGRLNRGVNVEWQWTSTVPVDFNVHFHEGKDVEYPTRLEQRRAAVGVLTAPKEQDYCWMWRNASLEPAAVSARLLSR